MTERKRVSFATMMKGEALARVDRGLEQVFENILNPNCPAKAKRSLVVTITFKPNEEREVSDTDVGVVLKLSPWKSLINRVYHGRRKGEIVSAEQNFRQGDLFEDDDDDEAEDDEQAPQADGRVVKITKEASA